MTDAFDYIKSVTKPDASDYEDLLGSVISIGLGVTSNSQRQSLQGVVGKAMEFLLVGILDMEHENLAGADLVCHKRKIVAEVKNRHNTLNRNSAKGMYDTIERFESEGRYKGYERYLVIVHPKSSGLFIERQHGVIEISAALFCNMFGVSFEKHYLELVRKTANFYNVPMPDITPYYRDVVFSFKPSTRRRKKTLEHMELSEIYRMQFS